MHLASELPSRLRLGAAAQSSVRRRDCWWLFCVAVGALPTCASRWGQCYTLRVRSVRCPCAGGILELTGLQASAFEAAGIRENYEAGALLRCRRMVATEGLGGGGVPAGLGGRLAVSSVAQRYDFIEDYWLCGEKLRRMASECCRAAACLRACSSLLEARPKRVHQVACVNLRRIIIYIV